jgi:hypothetical protein
MTLSSAKSTFGVGYLDNNNDTSGGVQDDCISNIRPDLLTKGVATNVFS